MTHEEFAAKLQACYPKAVDFAQADFDPDRSNFHNIASVIGYRFVGYRLKRAVFSTKPEDEDRVTLGLPKKDKTP